MHVLQTTRRVADLTCNRLTHHLGCHIQLQSAEDKSHLCFSSIFILILVGGRWWPYSASPRGHCVSLFSLWSFPSLPLLIFLAGALCGVTRTNPLPHRARAFLLLPTVLHFSLAAADTAAQLLSVPRFFPDVVPAAYGPGRLGSFCSRLPHPSLKILPRKRRCFTRLFVALSNKQI